MKSKKEKEKKNLISRFHSSWGEGVYQFITKNVTIYIYLSAFWNGITEINCHKKAHHHQLHAENVPRKKNYVAHHLVGFSIFSSCQFVWGEQEFSELLGNIGQLNI